MACVNDIAFDFYGKRFVTCANDKNIRLWDLNEETGEWKNTEIPRIHNESVWRLSWAHPEFGQLFASCSEDRTICIWEEQESTTQSSNRWQNKAQLSESKKAVNDVKFSPRHLGLKLASASADGYVRIYEATDVFSLNYWQLQESIMVEETSDMGGGGGGEGGGGGGGGGSGGGGGGGPGGPAGGGDSEHGLTCLSWNECPFEPAKIAVGGYSKRAVVLTLDNGRWREECKLGDASSGIVHDIAWAPAMGRSYHQIATASRESSCKIHVLKRTDTGLEYDREAYQEVKSQSGSPIWRVAWNATGTVLSTASDDGSMTLFRKDFQGRFQQVSSFE